MKQGCAVLGDPAYYGRFGFEKWPDCIYLGAPAPHFQALAFSGENARGEVTYHDAFNVRQ